MISALRPARSITLVLAVASIAAAQAPQPDAAPGRLLDTAELDQLTGPIALFPDALLAQMLPASLCPLDLLNAGKLLRRGVGVERMQGQDWDPSVKALVRCPGLVEMMESSLDWTQLLGYAFLNQPKDLLQSLQRRRQRATVLDNLVDGPQATPLVDGDILRIAPTDPTMLFVPMYEAATVYSWRPWKPGGFLAFGPGFETGEWLDLDIDWLVPCCYRPGWSWDHWRANIVCEGGKVVAVKRSFEPQAGELPPTAWQRDAARPFPLPGRPVVFPGMFDDFRGREEVASAPAPTPTPGYEYEDEPMMPWMDDRGRATDTNRWAPFDPTTALPRSSRALDRRNQRGTTAPTSPTSGSTPTPTPTPAARPAPQPQQGKPARQPPAQPATQKPAHQPARVAPPAVKVPPPPPAATTPAPPALTGGDAASERGAKSRGKKGSE